MEVMQYCIFAKESIQKMNGIRGKMCTQAGHAYVHSCWASEKRFPEYVAAFKDSTRAKKITLVVETVEELYKLQAAYLDVCGTSLVTDAGLTVFKEPTTTCLGIGPIPTDKIGDDLKALKTFT